MEYALYTLLLLVAVSTLLKVSLFSWRGIAAAALVWGGITVAIGRWAVEQPGDAAAAWLEPHSARQNLSFALLIEAMVMMLFCFRSAGGKRTVLRLYPGLLFGLAVAWSMTGALRIFTGVDFGIITWSAAAACSLFVAAGAGLFRFLLPTRALKLELLFACNFLITIFAIIIDGGNF